MSWLSKNKHSFLDPRGWSFFPRPALRETHRIPRSPAFALASFLRARPSSRTLALWRLGPFGEQVYSALRVKPDREPVLFALV